MAISPIDYAMVQRSTDVSMLKHHEDARPAVEQQNIQVHLERQDDAKMHQVRESEAGERTKNDADAKEEGRGQYKKRKKNNTRKEEQRANCVIKKQTTGRFDIKI